MPSRFTVHIRIYKEVNGELKEPLSRVYILKPTQNYRAFGSLVAFATLFGSKSH